MTGHDIIVIGASSGGIAALGQLVSQFPADLPASVFIVQHTAADSPGFLARILNSKGPLPAVMPADGDGIEPGIIYAAPPDRHLIVRPGHVHLSRGPQENRSRPAIDVLFRSAAIAYRARVIGVILTGQLNDGVAGLAAIQRCGGLAVVQDPADAAYAEMPRSALDALAPHYVLPLAEMGALLTRLAQAAAPEAPPMSPEIVAEARFADRNVTFAGGEIELGQPTSLSCPACNGPLQEMADDALLRYRCHVGHAYTVETLAEGQADAIERALWSALRLMEERVMMLSRMAAEEVEQGRQKAADRFTERSAEIRGHTGHLRELVQGIMAAT